MPQRINVYLPDDLHRALEAYRERSNVSRVCQEALARDVARLERVDQVDAPLPTLGEEERVALAGRLRAERERRESYWYDLGYRAAFEWARDQADPEALDALAAGEALQAQAVVGWVEGMQWAPPRQAAAARVWGALHQLAREVAERNGRAPNEDVRAFNRGACDGANAVWDAVRDDVVDAADGGEPSADGDDEGGSDGSRPDRPGRWRRPGTGRS